MELWLHPTSMKQITIKFDGLLLRSGWPLIHSSLSFRVVLNSSIKLSMKFANLGTMLPISCSSMGGKNVLYEQHGAHGGLFIYLNNKYVDFFHDVTILHKLDLYKNSH